MGGIGLSGAIPFISPKGARILSEAIQYRVFAVTGSHVSPGIFQKAMSFTNDLLDTFLTGEATPMSTWEWICSMPSRRRKQLIRALRQYEERGEFHAHFTRIQAFVKTEKLPYFGVVNGVYSPDFQKYVARLIQAPHDETHLVAGPYLKPLVGRLKEVWSYSNWLFYASVDPHKLDLWLNRNRCADSWFWADYSFFDATYSPEAWRMIESFYATIYPEAPPEFWMVLDAWRKPQGHIKCHKDDTVIKYDAPVMNASGRDDTALANALFNGIALALSIAAALSGKTVFELNDADVRLARELVNIAVVGDDSLVALRCDVAPIAGAICSNLRLFGLVVKSEWSYRLCDVTFLGQMPYPAAGNLYWGPTLGRRLYKAYWQEEPVGNLPAWVLGVAKQMLLYRHVPILYDMAQRITALLPGGKVTAFKHDPNRVWASRTAETPHYDASTLNWLADRYEEHGLSVAQIRADILTVTRVDRLPAVVRLHTTEVALTVDDL